MNHFKALVCILDRLGCDWPSKVVDWLISKAKTTMDELAELPAWNPNASTPSAAAAAFDPESSHRSLEQENQQQNNMLSDISADSPDVWVSRVIIPNGSDTGSVLLEKWVNTGGRPLGIAHGLHSELILADADKGFQQASDELGVFLLNRLNAQKKKGYESVYDRSNLSKWCTSSYLIMKLYLMKILGFSALVNLVFCSENSEVAIWYDIDGKELDDLFSHFKGVAGNKKITLGGFMFLVTSALLRNHFEKYGDITDLYMPKGKKITHRLVECPMVGAGEGLVEEVEEPKKFGIYV
ncbi:Transcription factor TCP4-like [Castilleja foliolosa]|uniref:Transcription factor TCP4-like n=1 Tax=Castilleja foliolosa TaxID=1961234 RepID=A0ABD3DQW3_9LAMI